MTPPFEARQVEDLRKLLRHAQVEKVDTIAHVLTSATREELDLLQARHPALMTFVLSHYATDSSRQTYTEK